MLSFVLCSLCPSPVFPACLQDLTAYKKFREKAVSSAARGLISLFRWGASSHALPLLASMLNDLGQVQAFGLPTITPDSCVSLNLLLPLLPATLPTLPACLPACHPCSSACPQGAGPLDA